MGLEGISEAADHSALDISSGKMLLTTCAHAAWTSAACDACVCSFCAFACGVRYQPTLAHVTDLPHAHKMLAVEARVEAALMPSALAAEIGWASTADTDGCLRFAHDRLTCMRVCCSCLEMSSYWLQCLLRLISARKQILNLLKPEAVHDLLGIP